MLEKSVNGALRAVALLGSMLLGARGAYGEVRYTVTDLGTLGGPESRASAVGATGQVTGLSHVAGAIHAFRWANGTMTDLGTLPQQTHSLGWGINSSGQVVGNSYTSGVGRAFLYSNGSMSDIGTLGGSNAFAQAINDVGQITGEAALANGTQNVFLYSGGQMIDLGKPGSGSAINNAGQIAGTANFGSGLHAFLYTGGQMMDLGTLLPGGFSSAEGINSLGHAVGFYEPQSGGRFVFRYANGQMTTLGSGVALGINSKGEVIGQEFVNSLGGFRARIYTDGQWTDLNQFIDPGSGWTLTDAEGINDLGQIVGSGVGPGGQLHGYLLTPIPEPAFVGLAALAVVALLRRR